MPQQPPNMNELLAMLVRGGQTQQPPPQGLQGPPQGLQGPPQGPPQGIPMPQGLPQGPPQGMMPGPPQGMPQGMPQGPPQGMPQGIPPGMIPNPQVNPGMGSMVSDKLAQIGAQAPTPPINPIVEVFDNAPPIVREAVRRRLFTQGM